MNYQCCSRLPHPQHDHKCANQFRCLGRRVGVIPTQYSQHRVTRSVLSQTQTCTCTYMLTKQCIFIHVISGHLLGIWNHRLPEQPKLQQCRPGTPHFVLDFKCMQIHAWAHTIYEYLTLPTRHSYLYKAISIGYSQGIGCSLYGASPGSCEA